ncbi:MAG: SH3 domain-containing protein [Lachnospiraceae bacterium]|nr:SH3 domain-containing protein [Lachnospiraceae bacterium]
MRNRILITLGAAFALALIPGIYSNAATISESIAGAGSYEILDEPHTEDEYKEAAKGVEAFGYSNLGIANVDNHLNVRESASEDGKLIGKMTNNAACEILGRDGDWIHIKSGDVEGYCHSDYLLTGQLALKRAESVITLEAESTSGGLRVRENPSTDAAILTTMGEGERLEVVEEEKDGWIKVMVDDQEGYISAEYAVIKEELDTAMTITELLYGQGVSDVRVDLCEYAKQFVGNKYVWGGTSLTKGADCSGFVLSVFAKYGISLPHSSAAQSKMGTKISLSEARPGDLIFYSNGKRVNHVAIYIGGGMIVHASNPRTGIRIQNASYRSISTVRRLIQD